MFEDKTMVFYEARLEDYHQSRDERIGSPWDEPNMTWLPGERKVSLSFEGKPVEVRCKDTVQRAKEEVERVVE